MSCSSAAAMTSASRIEPPGWMTALMPAFAASSKPSRKGKNASEPTTDPASGSRDRALEKDLRHLGRQRAVDRTVQRDDAAKRRHRIRLQRAQVRLQQALRRDRGPARVRVLDDDGRGIVELGAELQRGVQIQDVV